MAAGIETSIWLAQKASIEAIPDIPGTYPVAYPGEMFAPPDNAPYLRIGRASAAPNTEIVRHGAPSERLGSLIITIVYPLSFNASTSNYDYIASIITKHYQEGTNMRYNGVCLTVTSTPHVQEGYTDDFGYWSVPINIPWRSFV